MRPRAFRLLLPVAAALCAPSAGAGEVAPWPPPRIASELFESHGAFDPLVRDFYFVRSSREFRGWRILVSHCEAGGWSTPVDAPFAGDGVEADPWFTPDGRRLYFISTRSTDGAKHKDLDIWRVGRDAQGRWGEPERLPEPVNSRAQEWFPRLAPDGWLYFGSSRAGGHGKTDIWRARADAQGHWQVENLGAAINSAADEYEPLPSPDGRSLVVMAADGLYRAERQGDGWTPKRKIDAVTANGSEIGALFSPSGRSLLFSRDVKGERSGEFFVWHVNGDEAWPPACPADAPGT
jgi:hypothetical protein